MQRILFQHVSVYIAYILSGLCRLLKTREQNFNATDLFTNSGYRKIQELSKTQPYKDENQPTLMENTGLKYTGANRIINKVIDRTQVKDMTN